MLKMLALVFVVALPTVVAAQALIKTTPVEPVWVADGVTEYTVHVYVAVT